MVSTRTAFGQALAALGDVRPDVVVLDGEVSDSTRTSFFARAHPERFFECYAAEQQMVAAAIGMQVRGWVPFAATFAAFLSRAYDFIRMAAVSRASIRLVGSHSGVSVGEDGPSQMALEDIAALRAVHGSTVLCPCDANQAAWLTGVLADLPRGQLPAHLPRRHAGHLPAGRALRGRRQPRPALLPDDEVTLVGGRHHRARGAGGGGPAGRGRHLRPGSSTPTRSSRSTRSRCAPPAGRPGGSSPPRTTGRRADSATRCSARWRPERAGGRRAAAAGGQEAGRAGHARLGHAGRAAAAGGHRHGVHRDRGGRARRALTSPDARFIAVLEGSGTERV